MANPFLVLGGIAVGIVTAGFGVLQVPGWIASAQDASTINDLANVQVAQAAAASLTGAFASDLDSLRDSNGLRLTGPGMDSLTLDTGADAWCATAQSESGHFFAVSGDIAGTGAGPTVSAARIDAGCTPCPEFEWSATFFAGRDLQGAPLTSACLPTLDFRHSAAASPFSGVPGTNYSARFTRTLDEGAGTYNFTMPHDDGVRVWVDGDMVYDGWDISSGNTARTFAATLADGPHDIRIDYFQGPSNARLTLTWTVTPQAAAE